jgi:hypothetical protein
MALRKTKSIKIEKIIPKHPKRRQPLQTLSAVECKMQLVTLSAVECKMQLVTLSAVECKMQLVTLSAVECVSYFRYLFIINVSYFRYLFIINVSYFRYLFIINVRQRLQRLSALIINKSKH